MGTVIWFKNIRFEIRSRERNHIGRPHCHAVGKDSEASVDLITFEVLEAIGFHQKDLNQIVEKVKEFNDELIAKWEEYHGKEEDKLFKKERLRS